MILGFLFLHTQIYDLLFLIYLFLVVFLWFHAQICGTANFFFLNMWYVANA